ncbi:MAG: helix-turn-helix transcriptional regulator [Streptosporangiales bacterium]
MALKRLRLIQRRKALGFTQEELAGQLGCERTTVIRWERAETEPQPWLRPKLTQVLRLTAEELSELLADVADVPGQREGFTLVTSVPLDFSLSAAHTVRIMEGFSAHDIASRRKALAGLAVITGAALLSPVRQWAASLALLTGCPPDVGTDEVTELEQAVTLFRRWDASGAGGLRRKAVAGQLNAVAESLGEHHPARTYRAAVPGHRRTRPAIGLDGLRPGTVRRGTALLPAGPARMPRGFLSWPRRQDHR